LGLTAAEAAAVAVFRVVRVVVAVVVGGAVVPESSAN